MCVAGLPTPDDSQGESNFPSTEDERRMKVYPMRSLLIICKSKYMNMVVLICYSAQTVRLNLKLVITIKAMHDVLLTWEANKHFYTQYANIIN